MAKIIYSISGEGWGHSSRSKVILEHLFDKNHEVKIVTSGKGYEYLRQEFDVQRILGFRFAFKGTQVDIGTTIRENAKRLLKEGAETIKFLNNMVDRFKPDVVISDYEPFLPMVSAARSIPLITVAHVNIVENCKLDYPKSWEKERLLALAVCKMMNVSVEHYFIPSFYFPEITGSYQDNTTLVAPVLRKEVFAIAPESGSHVLVYVTAQESKDAMLPLMEIISTDVIAYGFQRSRVEHRNIVFKEPGTEGFLRDLASSRAVITNAGFNVTSEALYFGKPVYSIPIGNQFEQMVNGYYMEKLGYGIYDFYPSVERIQSFLESGDSYKSNIVRARNNFDGNTTFFQLLDSKIGALIGKITV